jgi:hypothetical protein
MLWSIGLDAAGAKHLGYDRLWPRRWDSSARQNGPAIHMPEGGRSESLEAGRREPAAFGDGDRWGILRVPSRGRLWYMLYRIILIITLQFWRNLLDNA